MQEIKKITLKDALRETYLEKKTFDAPGLKSRSFPIEESYVNLALINKPISHEENPEYGLTDEQDTQQLLIPLEKLFTPGAEETKNCISIEKILILGRAGIGKSTLCHYIAYQWANKGLLGSQFDYIFWVSLKTLDTDANKNDADLTASKFLYRTCLSGKYRGSYTEVELQEIHAAIYGSRCLILLDGYDEVTHLYTNNEHNGRVLKELLDLPHIILTSRPTQMNATLENRFNRRMENRGFTDENVKQYVHKIFPDKNEALGFIGFLQENPSIYGIAYIPLNLFLLCDLWGEEKNTELKDVTLTKLYQNFFRAFLKKRAITCNIFRADQNPTKNQLELKFSLELSVLSELAFRHFYPKVELIIGFSSIERMLSVKNISDITVEHLRDLGFIKPICPQDSQTDYYFIHKTFQEFFAAYYLFNALKNYPKDSPIFKEAITFIEHQKYYPAYAIVFWFLLGLLHDEKADKALSYVMDALLITSKDWIGFQHMILMIHILEQTEFDQAIPLETQTKIIEEIQDWIRVSILDNQSKIPKSLPIQLSQALILCPRIAYTTLSFFEKNWDKFSLTEKIKALDLYLTPIASILPKGAVLLLKLLEQSHQNQAFMEKALSVMPWQRLNYSKEREHFIFWLKAKLNDSQSDKICISAIKALILLKTYDESFILSIEKLTTSQDFWISLYAEIVFITLKDKLILYKTDNTFEKVIKLLNSKDTVEASKALEVCEFFILLMTELQKEKLIEVLFYMLRNAEVGLSEKAANLLDKFGQGNSEVQQRLWAALKPVEELASTTETLHKKLSLNERRIVIFQKNLTHQYYSIKIAAANALITLGINIPEAITTLIKALGDKTYWDRAHVASALGNLKQASPEVITALIEALKDKEWKVRAQAASALRNLKQITPNIIKALITALDDSFTYVSIEAASGLMQLGQESPEIIKVLLNTLRNSDWQVRTQATSRLETLKNEESEIRDVLIEDWKGDKNLDVRIRAAFLLGNLKQATPEVADTLIKALRDLNKDVRIQSASALLQLYQKSSEIINMMLIKNLRDRQNDGKIQPISELENFESEILSILIKALKDEHSWIRVEVAFTLGNLKQATPAVIDALIKSFLWDSDSSVKTQAAFALVQLDQELPDVIGVLINILRYPDLHITDMLRNLKQPTPEFVGDQINTLGGKSFSVRIQSVYTLILLVKESLEIINILIKALKNSDLYIKKQVEVFLIQLFKNFWQIVKESPEAIAALIKAFEDSDLDIRAQILTTLGDINQATPKILYVLIKALEDSDSDVRIQAASALGNINQAAPEIIAALIKALEDTDSGVRTQSMFSLMQLSKEFPDVIISIIYALESISPDIRTKAAYILGNLKKATLPVIPALIKALEDSSLRVRIQAVSALGNLNQATPEVIAVLIKTLGDCLYNIRIKAASALQQLGQKSTTVIDELIKALKDSSYDIRIQSVLLLGKLLKKFRQIAKEYPAVVDVLIKALDDSDLNVRIQAISLLGKLKQAPPTVIIALIKILEDPLCIIKIQAMSALEKLKQPKLEFIGALTKILEDSNSDIRAQSAFILVQLGQESPDIINILIKILMDEYADVKIQTTAVIALGILRQVSSEIIEILIKALGHSNSIIRTQVTSLLVKLNEESPKVIGALIKALEHSDLSVKTQAAFILAQLGQESPVVISTLIKAYGDSDLSVRAQATSLLENLKQVTPEILSILIKEVHGDESNDIKMQTASELEYIKQAMSEIIDMLIKLLGNSNQQVRTQATFALVQLGQKWPDVLFSLVKALRNTDLFVRTQAAFALRDLKQVMPQVIGALIKASRDLDSYHSVILVDLKQVMPVVISSIITALKSSNLVINMRAVSALEKLANLKQVTREIIDALITIALRDSNQTRGLAKSVLVKLGKKSPDIVTAVIEALSDSDSDVRVRAISMLKDLKQTSSKVINVFIKALRDSDLNVRIEAATALVNLKQASPEIIAVLIHALGDESLFVRTNGASALGDISELEEEYFLALIHFIENPENKHTDAAITALSKVKIKLKIVKLNVDNLIFILHELSSNDADQRQKALKDVQKLYHENTTHFFEVALQTMYSYPKATNSIITVFLNFKCNSQSLFVAYKAWINRDLEALNWTENLWLPLIYLILQEGSSLTYPDKGILVLQGSDGRQEWCLPYGERNHLLLTLMSALKKEVENLKLPVHFYDEFFGVKSARFTKRSSCFFNFPVLKSAEYPSIFNPQLIVDREHWVLSFIRKGDDPHVFMIIEGMTASGKAILQRVDLTTTGASKGKAKIVFLNPEELKKTIPNIEIETSPEGVIMLIEKISGVIESKFVTKQPCYGFVWQIKRDQFRVLMKNITEDQKQGERPFSQYGDQSYLSYYSYAETGDNCFTWSCRHLKALNHNLINRDLQPTYVNNIAADPRYYLTICLIHEPPKQEKCLLM